MVKQLSTDEDLEDFQLKPRHVYLEVNPIETHSFASLQACGEEGGQCLYQYKVKNWPV